MLFFNVKTIIAAYKRNSTTTKAFDSVLLCDINNKYTPETSSIVNILKVAYAK